MYLNSDLLFYDNKNKFRNGELVSFEGKIKRTKSDGNFNYEKYLAKDNIMGVLSNPKINKIVDKNYALRNFGYKFNFIFYSQYLKNAFIKKLYDLKKGEETSLLVAIIFGEKKGLDSKIKEKFNISGISHIIAVSGLHIAVIVKILFDGLSFLGFDRKMSFLFTVCFVFLFVAVIGFPASSIRALLMFGTSYMAKLIGRRPNMSLLLLFSANIILFFKPYYLLFDVGFQFSFLAFWALINFSPKLALIQEKILNSVLFNKRKGIEEKIKQIKCLKLILRNLNKAIIATASILLVTFPLTFYYFERMTLVSILSNVLIFWVVFPIIFLGFFSLILSFISVYFAKIVFLFNMIFIKYLYFIVEKLSKLDLFVINIESFDLRAMIFCYVFIFLFFFIWLGILKSFNLQK